MALFCANNNFTERMASVLCGGKGCNFVVVEMVLK